MAISPQEFISKFITGEDLVKLEEDIDKNIQCYLEKKKRWWSRRIKLTVKLFWSGSVKETAAFRDTLVSLIQFKKISNFLKRYTQKEGWTVKYGICINGTPYLHFYKIIDPEAIKLEEDGFAIIDSREEVLSEQPDPDEEDDAKIKKARLNELRARMGEDLREIQRLEADLQFSTESPNSRDPAIFREP